MTETKLSGVIEIRPEDGLPYVISLDNIDLAHFLVNAILDELKRKREQTQDEERGGGQIE